VVCGAVASSKPASKQGAGSSRTHITIESGNADSSVSAVELGHDGPLLRDLDPATLDLDGDVLVIRRRGSPPRR
jgi:hypothetical protein